MKFFLHFSKQSGILPCMFDFNPQKDSFFIAIPQL